MNLAPKDPTNSSHKPSKSHGLHTHTPAGAELRWTPHLGKRMGKKKHFWGCRALKWYDTDLGSQLPKLWIHPEGSKKVRKPKTRIHCSVLATSLTYLKAFLSHSMVHKTPSDKSWSLPSLRQPTPLHAPDLVCPDGLREFLPNLQDPTQMPPLLLSLAGYPTLTELVPGTSLVVQWSRVCLWTWVRTPFGELRSTHRWATRESPRAAMETQGRQKKKKRKFSERELFLSTPQGTVGSTPRGNASHTLNPEGAQHILPSVFTSVWSLPRQCLPGLNQTLEAKCVSFKCPSSGMETYPRTQRIHCQK